MGSHDTYLRRKGLADRGMDARQAAVAEGIAHATMLAWARKNGIAFVHGSKGKHRFPDRDARLVARRAEGLTLEQLSSEFGITRERARQIVKRSGNPDLIGRVSYKSMPRPDILCMICGRKMAYPRGGSKATCSDECFVAMVRKTQRSKHGSIERGSNIVRLRLEEKLTWLRVCERIGAGSMPAVFRLAAMYLVETGASNDVWSAVFPHKQGRTSYRERFARRGRP
jgi:predicted nucleic acid-binding Zn ribbon protein